MKKTIIYLVRHGEVHNPEDIFYARLPGFKLSKRGEHEAMKLAEHLKSKPISAIYTSSLERARQTAGYLAARRPEIPIIYDDRLLEVRTPAQGMKFEILRKSDVNLYTDALIAQGGETINDVWMRVSEFIHDAGIKHIGEEIAAYTHGDLIMITKAVLERKPLIIESIRGGYYVPHAKGIQVTVNGDKITTIDIEY